MIPPHLLFPPFHQQFSFSPLLTPMEERERSLSDEKNGPLYDGNRESIESHEATKAISHTKEDDPSPESTKNGSATQDDDPLPLPVSSQPAMYVVQVPKDQIYRVPPPEHALMLAERHALQKKHKGSHCFPCPSCCSVFPFGRSRRKESATTQKPDSDI